MKYTSLGDAKVIPFERPPPTRIVVSDEEFEHALQVFRNPKGPTPAILRGAALLREIAQERGLIAPPTNATTCASAAPQQKSRAENGI